MFEPHNLFQGGRVNSCLFTLLVGFRYRDYAKINCRILRKHCVRRGNVPGETMNQMILIQTQRHWKGFFRAVQLVRSKLCGMVGQAIIHYISLRICLALHLLPKHFLIRAVVIESNHVSMLLSLVLESFYHNVFHFCTKRGLINQLTQAPIRAEQDKVGNGH